MKKFAVIVLLFALLGSVVAVAGDNPNNKPPKYLWIQAEQYQAGKEAAYMKLGQAFKEAMSNTDAVWLAEMAVAGNGNEMIYVTFHDNFASVEKMIATFMKIGPEMQQKNAALMAEGQAAIGRSQAFIAEFEPDLSLLSDKVTPAQTTRYKVTTLRVKPGTGLELVELFKEARAMHVKAGDDAPYFIYRVVAGEPSPAYLLIKPLKTLADLDETSPAYEAMLTPVVRKQFNATIKNTVSDWHAGIYLIDPRLSLPPKNYLAENPGFWKVPEPAPVAVKGKKAKKVVEPAAMKEKH